MKPVRVPPRGDHLVNANLYATTITVASSGTANTKGAWQTLFASTIVDASSLLIRFDEFAASGAERSCLFDIAIGPSGAPTLIAENIQWSYLNNAATGYPIFELPLLIPAGSEIIIRFQAPITFSLAVTAAIAGGNRNLLAFDRMYTYGADTTDSAGTSLPQAGAINTKGAWQEIVASTDEDFHALGVGFGIDWGPGLTSANYAIDIGIGAGGSEQVLLADLNFQSATSESIFNIMPRTFPVSHSAFVPAGSRLSARSQASSISSLAVVNVTLHGFAGIHGFHSYRRLASSKSLLARLEA